MSLPAHRSFSQMSSFFKCMHSYYLSKIAQVPEQPAVYLAAGNAVHSMLEAINHELYSAQMQGGSGAQDD